MTLPLKRILCVCVCVCVCVRERERDCYEPVCLLRRCKSHKVVARGNITISKVWGNYIRKNGNLCPSISALEPRDLAVPEVVYVGLEICDSWAY